ncbi:hypothetical protein [Microbacterium timonense]|jgi:hypothetical protein|uniref:hypothetical protein n=1 Tax=Microbacterium timonense TaxID=2086576 RepID=UPI000D110A1C|nr:hypothetical protein [Microbacterium timonense]
MTDLALHVNGARFHLADKYSAEDLALFLSRPTGEIVTLDLADGGAVRFGVTTGLAWAVEELA